MAKRSNIPFASVHPGAFAFFPVFFPLIVED
jgi:hypothetical protein